jgi:poly-gamma-glutamate capsule biosynthesis protein CapA/YwtB (metallophosphatase superfamily)
MVKLFLAGDVMLARGIDQILERPGDPRLYESYMRTALGYVRLAEQRNGPIPRGVDLDYVWGDAAASLAAGRPDFGIVNLETAITDRGTPEPKGINYRMSVANAGGLRRLPIDCCVLANNHTLDWGVAGLLDTIATLRRLALPFAGAGADKAEAGAPAVLRRDGAGVLVLAMACRDSGVPASWAAGPDSPGVNLLHRLDEAAVKGIRAEVEARKRPGDAAVASIHWGGNWGYEIPLSHRRFARALVSHAGIDLVHGHSSHHAKGWEIHEGRLILYGVGDFINDYEGISGNEQYGDLTAMYLPELDPAGRLTALTIVPFSMWRFSLKRAGRADARWLCDRLNRECASPGPRLAVTAEDTLVLRGI